MVWFLLPQGMTKRLVYTPDAVWSNLNLISCHQLHSHSLHSSADSVCFCTIRTAWSWPCGFLGSCLTLCSVIEAAWLKKEGTNASFECGWVEKDLIEYFSQAAPSALIHHHRTDSKMWVLYLEMCRLLCEGLFLCLLHDILTETAGCILAFSHIYRDGAIMGWVANDTHNYRRPCILSPGSRKMQIYGGFALATQFHHIRCNSSHDTWICLEAQQKHCNICHNMHHDKPVSTYSHCKKTMH